MKTLIYGKKYGVGLVDCTDVEHIDSRGKSTLYVGWNFSKQKHVLLVKKGLNNKVVALMFDNYKLEQRSTFSSDPRLIPTILIDVDLENEIILECSEEEYARTILERRRL